MGQDQVSGWVSVLCRQATSGANVLLRPFGRPSSVIISWVIVMSDRWRMLWPCSRIACNIRERGTSYCLTRSLYRHRTSLRRLHVQRDIFLMEIFTSIGRSRGPQNKTCILRAGPCISYKLCDKNVKYGRIIATVIQLLYDIFISFPAYHMSSSALIPPCCLTDRISASKHLSRTELQWRHGLTYVCNRGVS